MIRMKDIIRDINKIETKIRTLKKVGSNSATWEVYYLNTENDQKWVKEYPNSAHHGGGSPILRKVAEFPRYDLETKNIYISAEAHMKLSKLQVADNCSNLDSRYYFDDLTGEKWIKEYFSSLETDGILTIKLTRISEYPWE